jgi:exonuclease VII small subunit
VQFILLNKTKETSYKIGNHMNKKEMQGIKDELFMLFKIVNKLEQRIASLEKVLDSHAKCIGELRGTELRIHDLKDKNE